MFGEDSAQFNVILPPATLENDRNVGGGITVANALPGFPGGINWYTLLLPSAEELKLAIAPKAATAGLAA
ncbi:hypothetical protein D9M72_582840 [compost metagenome]